MEPIFYSLDNAQDMIFTASIFAETSLKATEEVVLFSDAVELVGDDTFQKLYSPGN